MKEILSVVEENTPPAPSEISTVQISSEANTPADNQIVSTSVVQQKPKSSKIFSKMTYFLLGSIFIFLGLAISLEGPVLWSLLCFFIAIAIFKFEVSKLIAPTKPKFLHLVMYIGYLTVASICLIFGLLMIVSSPIAGIFFLFITIICLNFAFSWKPEEQIVRSNEAGENLLKALLVAGKILLKAFLSIGKNFLKALEKWSEKRKLEKNRLRDINVILARVDGMEGYEFEGFLKSVFERLGYSVTHTPLSGDQGADLILSSKDKGRIAVQAKRYSSKVSNKAVQEVVASKALYKCTEGLVVTNNYFTASAVELAKANGIGLIDRDELKRIIIKSYKLNNS